jgi:predicted acylesterase/phospholipase RssA
MDPAPIRALLAQHLPENFGELQHALDIWATREQGGIQECFTAGPILLDAVLASAAISGVFPPVTIAGMNYCDGGVGEYLPLPRRFGDYDEIYLLVSTPPVDYATRNHGIISRLIRNADWMIDRQIVHRIHDAKLYGHQLGPKIFLVRPSVDRSGSSMRFNHDLVAIARNQTVEQLQAQEGGLTLTGFGGIHTNTGDAG